MSPCKDCGEVPFINVCLWTDDETWEAIGCEPTDCLCAHCVINRLREICTAAYLVIRQGRHTIQGANASIVMAQPKRKFVVGTPEYYDSFIDCAAVKSTDGQIWTGKRHSHCFATIKQAGLKPSHADQGFMTMSGRYVTREEGAALVLKTGQCVLDRPDKLYSENLY